MNIREWEQAYRNEWKQYREERTRKAQQSSPDDDPSTYQDPNFFDIVTDVFSRAFHGDTEAMLGVLILISSALLIVFVSIFMYKNRHNFNIRKIKSLQISQIFLIGFLLTIATMPSWRISSGVYTLLRILTTTISAWSAVKTDNNILRLIFAFIAILFNPVILIKLDRDDWQTIDMTVAIFYLGIVIYSLFKAKHKQD